VHTCAHDSPNTGTASQRCSADVPLADLLQVAKERKHCADIISSCCSQTWQNTGRRATNSRGPNIQHPIAQLILFECVGSFDHSMPHLEAERCITSRLGASKECPRHWYDGPHLRHLVCTSHRALPPSASPTLPQPLAATRPRSYAQRTPRVQLIPPQTSRCGPGTTAPLPDPLKFNALPLDSLLVAINWLHETCPRERFRGAFQQGQSCRRREQFACCTGPVGPSNTAPPQRPLQDSALKLDARSITLQGPAPLSSCSLSAPPLCGTCCQRCGGGLPVT
jgi:hypothetical protein